ncbi:MAG: DUF2586 family protein [Bacteroidales bacterium]|nr:DUF2586 family protein [Bacteroidales bacterium]
MPLPNISFIINRSGLGLVSVLEDGVMGIVLSGVAVIGGLQLNKAYSINKLSEAEALGIVPTVEDIDEDENPITVTGPNARAYRQIKMFYDEIGEGAKLWFIVMPEESADVVPVPLTLVDSIDYIKTMIDYAKGEIKHVGVCRVVGAPAGELVDGLHEEVMPMIVAAQTLCDTYQAKVMPFSVTVDGIDFEDQDAIVSLKTLTKHRVSVLLAANAEKEASIGQFLARLASSSVQQKASRVRSGALSNLTAHLVGSDIDIDTEPEKLGTLHDKGYIVYRAIIGVAGYFYSGDPTATSNTDDLNIIPRNRIIDKVIVLSYNTYIEELDEDIEVDDSGKIPAPICADLQRTIEKQVKANTVGEISNFTAYVNPNQDILSGLPFDIVLSVTPRGYLNPIRITIGFINPYLNS